MSFAPKPGCPMCSIVASAQNDHVRSPTSSSSASQPEILWKDENFTAYRERANPVSSVAHVIIAFNLHVPSIYSLSATDLPLLVNVRNIANRLLTNCLPPTSPAAAPYSSSSFTPTQPNPQFRIGFITPPFKDNKIPVTDHLHAHAYILPSDLMGWWRGVAYGALAWYAIDDLIAEIRESVSNNRVKSGYDKRTAPIDLVPSAGARTGTADGVDTTEPGLNREVDLEGGEASPSSPRTPSPSLLSPGPVSPGPLSPSPASPSLLLPSSSSSSLAS